MIKGSIKSNLCLYILKMIKWRFLRLRKCLDNLPVNNITFSQSLEVYSELQAMRIFL